MLKRNFNLSSDSDNIINDVINDIVAYLHVSNDDMKLVYEYLCSLYKILYKNVKNIDNILIDNILFPLTFIKNDIINNIDMTGAININDIMLIYDIIYNHHMMIQERDLYKLYNNIFVPLNSMEIGTYQIDNVLIGEIGENKKFFTKKLFIIRNEENPCVELLDNNFILY